MKTSKAMKNIFMSTLLAGMSSTYAISPSGHGALADKQSLKKLKEQKAKEELMRMTKSQVDKSDYNNLASLLKELNDASDYGVAFGASLGAQAGVGAAFTYALEMVSIENGGVAFYCAPGVNLTAGGVGASVGTGVTVMNIYNCPTNQDYTGNFLTVATSAKFGIVGGLSHSWGSNMDHFLTELEELKQRGLFRPSEIKHEIAFAVKWIYSVSKSRLKSVFGSRLLCSMAAASPQEFKNSDCDQLLEEVEGKQNLGINVNEDNVVGFLTDKNASKKFEVMSLFEEMVQSEELKHEVPNIIQILKVATDGNTFSGCNSWAADLSLEPSAGLSVSTSLTHYSLGIELNKYDYWEALKGNRDISELMDKNVNAIEAGLDNIMRVCPDSRHWMAKDSKRFYELFMTPVENTFDRSDVLEIGFGSN